MVPRWAGALSGPNMIPLEGGPPLMVASSFRLYLYGLGICPVSTWFVRLATRSSSIWLRVRSCIRANLGAEYEARSPLTILVRSHSLNMGPLSKTLCSHKYGLYAPTSSLDMTDTSYLVCFRFILGEVRTKINVCKKWDLIQLGENGVLSASRKTTHTISLPMCRLRWSCEQKTNVLHVSSMKNSNSSLKGIDVFNFFEPLQYIFEMQSSEKHGVKSPHLEEPYQFLRTLLVYFSVSKLHRFEKFKRSTVLRSSEVLFCNLATATAVAHGEITWLRDQTSGG